MPKIGGEFSSRMQNFMGMEVFLQKERTFFQAPIKLAQPFSGPSIVGKTFYGHEGFSEFLSPLNFATHETEDPFSAGH